MKNQVLKLLWIVVTGFSVVACQQSVKPDAPVIDAEASEISAEHTRVANNIVSSETDPALKIKIDASFEFLGRHDIRIRDIAAGERLIFADVEDSKAKRLFILQYEGLNEGIDEVYRYDLSKSPEVAGYRWRSNAYAFNMTDNIKNNPGSESDSTAAFMAGLDITHPDNWMMWRSLTVTSADKKNELILFYMEDLDSTGKSLADIYDEEGESTEYWQGLMPALERRANSSFALAAPGSDDWHEIPRYFDGVE